MCASGSLVVLLRYRASLSLLPIFKIGVSPSSFVGTLYIFWVLMLPAWYVLHISPTMGFCLFHFTLM